MMPRFAAALVCTLLASLLAMPCAGQVPGSPPANASVYERLALDCLAEVPGEAAALRLVAPESLPYVREALVARWQADGRTVYTGDPLTPGAPVPTLTYAVDESAVRYARAGRRAWERTVVLRLRYDWTETDGSLARSSTCAEPFRDTIRRGDVARLEDPVFGETVGAPPRASWVRRYGEPLVVMAAIGVGTALLFSVRSDAAQ